MPKAKFDSYASSYNDLHRDSTRIAGDDPDHFASYKVAYLAESLKRASEQPKSILDFGCGVGNCLSHLVKAFPDTEIHGLDVSSESIEVARANFPTAQLDIISDKLPLASNSIEVAIAVGVFHHIHPTERTKWMNELKRVLCDGGKLYIFEHNPFNPVTRMIVDKCPFDDDAILLPPRESACLMQDAGFRDMTCDYVMFFPSALSFLRPAERYLRKIPMGAQYVALGVA